MWGLGCRSSFEPRRWQNPTDGRFARKPTTVVAGHSGDTPVRSLDATNPSYAVRPTLHQGNRSRSRSRAGPAGRLGCRSSSRRWGAFSLAAAGARFGDTVRLLARTWRHRRQGAPQPVTLGLVEDARGGCVRRGSSCGGGPPPLLGSTPCTRLKSLPAAPRSEGEWSPCPTYHRPDLVAGLRRKPHTGHDRWHTGFRRLPGLLFVPVPDEKTTKNRLHLDFRPDDRDAEVQRLLALGATRADEGQGEQSWVVLADPEGNETRSPLRPRSTASAAWSRSYCSAVSGPPALGRSSQRRRPLCRRSGTANGFLAAEAGSLPSLVCSTVVVRGAST